MGAVLVTLMATTATAFADSTVRWFISENTPQQTVWMREVAKRYEESRPGTRIDIQVMSGEPYKAKLTTMLQSSDRPHLIYTWGGGVLFAQAQAGLLQDITDKVKGAWANDLSPAALEAMSYQGRTYGAPTHLSQVVLWYNRRLLAQAGIDPASLGTWDGLLAATRRLKEAGIQPFTAGGSDKWPLNMFWSGLALRIGGRQGFQDALERRTGGGFDGPVFTRASEMFKQLVDLEPFQRGFLGDTAPQAAGQFGDGKAALQVMGNWFYNTQRSQSSGQKGIPDEDLGWMPFPAVSGGKGEATDVVGGINGFLVTRGAPPEAVDFLRYYTSPAVQREGAERGFFIPAARGAGEALKNPFFRQISDYLQRASYVQNFYDQMLGPSVGRVVNDTSADLAAGRMTPRQVGRQIQDAWDLEQ
ncbi:carbohydrate ABC transporter substrate-binding protein [Roseomonas marmotae]|uniref:Carbohydrate ABC transporter substrate-binding protein n=2 Tax=Roseomonas marmotae TaxID=2768161 RepID=A0ABS3KDY4_9PROT|nr:carbohydrate ABC transporter substrate-binding protein [Roseomonas marmotae]QTI80785.1 carbohydrate ABC transporter substrate-binding protein [Roseomonas marmotae]